MASNNFLQKISAELIDTGRDPRYKVTAYDFVLKGLEFYLAKLGEKRHVSGQELSMGLLEFASAQFGQLAFSVLKHWGINSTDDFGYIVYNMISIGLMNKQPQDSLEDFFGVIDLAIYFNSRSTTTIDKNEIKKIKGA